MQATLAVDSFMKIVRDSCFSSKEKSTNNKQNKQIGVTMTFAQRVINGIANSGGYIRRFQTLDPEAARMWDQSEFLRAGYSPEFLPRVNMYEGEKACKVIIEVPGVDEKNLEITLQDSLLLVKGTRKEPIADALNPIKIESEFGAFVRTIQVPFKVDQDNVVAQYKNGLLLIHLPKSQETLSNTRRIELTSKSH